MRLKKSFVVLLVLLISLTTLAGVVRSLPVPLILASTTATGVKVQGSGWTANTVVTLYFDVIDANHKVCEATTDYSGSFVASFPLAGTVEGTHTVTAIQGAMLATAAFTVGSTSPPDDRILNPILAISSNLSSIAAKLNVVDAEVKAIEAKLDAGGSFYNFVNGWFYNVSSNLNSYFNTVNGKLNNVKVEQVIEGTVHINFYNLTIAPDFVLSCSQPWDLMAVYISTKNMKSNGFVGYGNCSVGDRVFERYSAILLNDDVKDYPVFPSDITEEGVSIVAVPPAVPFHFHYSYCGVVLGPGYDVSFKIVIQRPLDPSFTYNVVFG